MGMRAATGAISEVCVRDGGLECHVLGNVAPVKCHGLAGRSVLALKVATDNQRVAVITSDREGGDVRVVVAGIVRSASGRPLSLSPEPLRGGWTLTAAKDLAWVDDSTLAVVGRVSPKEPVGPQLVEIGGRITAMPPVAGTRLVTNTGGLCGVVVWAVPRALPAAPRRGAHREK